MKSISLHLPLCSQDSGCWDKKVRKVKSLYLTLHMTKGNLALVLVTLLGKLIGNEPRCTMRLAE